MVKHLNYTGKWLVVVTVLASLYCIDRSLW